MIEPADHIVKLLVKKAKGELTEQELVELSQWLKDKPERENFVQKITGEVFLLKEAGSIYLFDQQKIFKKVSDKFFLANPAQNENKHTGNIYLLGKRWFGYAAAVILILCISTYLRITTQQDKSPITHTQPVPGKDDILPGHDKATLTLSDGRQITLDSGTKKIISEGTLAIQNTNGELLYAPTDLVVYNTMVTPRGGQYKLTLADGTRVWLNAASSVTYPTTFDGTTRSVTITGEVYFEVAPNKSKPFIVTTRKESIRVIGTSFNVSAYEGESSVKTSLLEGIVKINNIILHPGQAFIDNKIITTNIDQDLAWKDGRFDFNRLKMREAMKQIARWYDVEVKYEGAVQDIEFVGGLKRTLTLNQVLSFLEKLDVHFRLDGRVLTVMP